MIEVNLLNDTFNRPCAHRAVKVIRLDIKFRFVVLTVLTGFNAHYNLRKVKTIEQSKDN